MSRAKIAISIDGGLLERLDRLVDGRTHPSRSRVIEKAVEEKLERVEKTRLARECRKQDPAMEKALAEEGMSEALEEWPEY